MCVCYDQVSLCLRFHLDWPDRWSHHHRKKGRKCLVTKTQHRYVPLQVSPRHSLLSPFFRLEVQCFLSRCICTCIYVLFFAKVLKIPARFPRRGRKMWGFRKKMRFILNVFSRKIILTYSKSIWYGFSFGSMSMSCWSAYIHRPFFLTRHLPRLSLPPQSSQIAIGKDLYLTHLLFFME